LLASASGGELQGEPTLLRQLLLNLVTNALAVTPADGTITLTARRNSAGWRFTLTDEGPGLRPEQIERAFDRFVRFEVTPGQAAARGHGLGLAICRSIAALHHGVVRAENRGDRSGLRVTVELPDRPLAHARSHGRVASAGVSAPPVS
jgi:signal transduction histidine kinase